MTNDTWLYEFSFVRAEFNYIYLAIDDLQASPITKGEFLPFVYNAAHNPTLCKPIMRACLGPSSDRTLSCTGLWINTPCCSGEWKQTACALKSTRNEPSLAQRPHWSSVSFRVWSGGFTNCSPSQLQFNRTDTWELDQGCISPIAWLLGWGQMER